MGFHAPLHFLGGYLNGRNAQIYSGEAPLRLRTCRDTAGHGVRTPHEDPGVPLILDPLSPPLGEKTFRAQGVSGEKRWIRY